MATIDMRGSDQSFSGVGVGFGSQALHNTPTAYVWNGPGLGASNLVYLYGNGITSAGGAPTAGTIDQIRIDLAVRNDNLFWEAILQNNDTIHAFNPGLSVGPSYAFGDGVSYAGSVGATASDDTLDATGTLGQVYMFGDYVYVDSATLTAGDDHLLCDEDEGNVDGTGDVQYVHADAGDAIVRGGDDVIDIASDSSQFLIGDVLVIFPAATAGFDILVTGGDDTISNRGDGSPFIAGDVYTLNDEAGGGTSTVGGGSDNITGGGEGELIAGDVYTQESGFVDGGDDIIEAGGGDDNIAGDVLFHTGGTFTGGNDIIDGGLDNDTIDGQAGNDTAQFLSNARGVVVVLDSGGADGSAVGQGSDVLRDIENVLASTEDDTVTGNSEANIALGFDGDDSLSGLGGADQMFGLDDTDTLSGGEGADTLDGGPNSDFADYSAAANAVTIDLSLAGPQDTGQGLDLLFSIERLIGSAHADALTGSAAGNYLRGLGGLDTLTGGNGSDKFDFNVTTDSGDTNSTADIITDFDQGSDVIELSTIDAKLGTASNQAFTFIGTDSFSTEGEVRYSLSEDGATTHVRLNTTGNDGTDMTISLTGAFTLTNQDFLL